MDISRGNMLQSRSIMGRVWQQQLSKPLCRGFHVSKTGPQTQYLEVTSKYGTRQIAYQKTDGPRTPGIIYIPGFMACKSGVKASMLAPFCQKYGFPYVRYDPSGLGETIGMETVDANFSVWLDDAAHVLEQLTDGPQLIVASSMGCWISSVLAKRYPEKFDRALLLAPAFNFNRKYLKVLRSQLPPKMLATFEADEVVKLFAPGYGEIPMRKRLFEDMYQYEVSMESGSIPIICPTRIIHGVEDKDVPYKESLQLLSALATPDAHLLYLKDGSHQLQEKSSLESICDTILQMTAPKPTPE